MSPADGAAYICGTFFSILPILRCSSVAPPQKKKDIIKKGLGIRGIAEICWFGVSRELRYCAGWFFFTRVLFDI